MIGLEDYNSFKRKGVEKVKNNELIPFERNRYFSGKMLTSSDFQAEQNYNNNKRRFMNQVVLGSGIICGCGVFSLDDLSLLIESGAAIDGAGREIVIENSVVKKVSAIAGFEELRTNNVSLCVRYKEEDVHAVYSVNREEGGSEYEHNRVAEGYELFLADTEDIENGFEMETEFFAEAELLSTEDYSVRLRMPATVSAGRYAKAVVAVTKLSEASKKLNYETVLQMPGFTSSDNEHELKIQLQGISLEQGGKVEKEYWMKVQTETTPETAIVMKAGSTKATVDGVVAEGLQNLNLQVVISDIHPRDLALWENNKISLEMRGASALQDYIRLADLKLVRTETAYIIEEIEERSVKRYIPTLAGEKKHQEYQSYYRDEMQPVPVTQKVSDYMERGNVPEYRMVPEIETGILEIPLNANAKKGDIRYSGEVMHGLGKGNVYVEIGYEKLENVSVDGGNSKTTIYGNPDFFKGPEESSVCVETAVKVLNDKGSFIVAVKFLKDVEYLVLTFRWVAIKFPTGERFGIAEDYSNKSISAETPTVVLGTKESYYFNVKFNNMKSCSIAYELTEPGSGEISPDGIYTAPTKEGVYEIRIYCTDAPMICTYAYAIVKKKDGNSSEETP
ncbi:MAG: hypothetical protein IJ040_03800 [Lachnospiraceae bacterium]|nr:hypothetical protein [Lachnospiraceae bacterium]